MEENKNNFTLNRLVMDYLLTAGYPSAAENFATEADLTPVLCPARNPLAASVSTRSTVRNAILRGDILSAIEQIQTLNPMILDTHPTLHFSLLRQHLTELIRPLSNPNADIGPVLDFAAQNLAPLAPLSSNFLADFEQTMCLLIMPRENLGADPQMARLLDTGVRVELARWVNRCLLGEESEGNPS
ncbi:hypothetical protein KEM55_001241, partial [Ascosphaera atra]